jgi:hypothetical protein
VYLFILQAFSISDLQLIIFLLLFFSRLRSGPIATLRHSLVMLNYCCWERATPDPAVFLKFLDRVRNRYRKLNQDVFSPASSSVCLRRDFTPLAIIDQPGSSKAGTFMLSDFLLHRLEQLVGLDYESCVSPCCLYRRGTGPQHCVCIPLCITQCSIVSLVNALT